MISASRTRSCIIAATVVVAAAVFLLAPVRQVVAQDCSTAGCHDDLASAPVVHAPVAGEECTVCHEPRSDEHSFQLAAESVAELCVMCHDDPAEGVTVPHDAMEMGCTSCHDPHGSNTDALLAGDPVSVCSDCHVEQGEELNLPVRHDVVGTFGCSACHDPHGGAESRLLRVAGNGLCLACHAPAGRDASASELPDALRGHVPADDSRFEGAPRVQLGANGLGHPVLKHPVSGPSNPRLKERPFECSSCHRPHAASAKSLLFAPSGWVFCSQCHRR